MSDVEKTVRDYYDRFGWAKIKGALGDDPLFREFLLPHYPYHEVVNARTMNCFSSLSGKLLMAGGGDLPETHVAIAQGFSATTCLDISHKALEIAKRKLKDKGEYILGSILDIPKPDGYFDAVFCAHVIYHIDRDLQEKAVRELIRVTRSGGRIVIIYSNPRSLPKILMLPKRLIRKIGGTFLIWRLRRRRRSDKTERPPLYFFAYPLKWWNQFGKKCEVRLIPWDVMSSEQEKEILVNDKIARLVYRFCSWFENKYPKKAVQWWQFPVIVLNKK